MAAVGPKGQPRTAFHLSALPLLMLATVAVRLYYFSLTTHQPVWWDEAEYLLKAKALAFGTPDTGYFEGRPPVLPLFLAGVFRAGLGEPTIRLLLVAISVACVFLTYRIGRLLFDEPAALAGAWLFGCFYLEVFYTLRIMTEVPHQALVLLGVESLLSRRRSWPVESGVALSLAAFTRYPAVLMFVPMGIYVLVTEGRPFKNRAHYVFLAVSAIVAAPFLLSAYLAYGDPVHQLRASRYLMPSMDARARLDGVFWYVNWLRSSLGLVLSALVGFGLFITSCGIARSRFRLARSRIPGGDLLVLMWIATPVVYFGAFVRPLEDRYLVLVLPPLFLACGRTLAVATNLLSRFERWQRSLLFTAVVVAAGLFLLVDTDRIVNSRRKSYLGLQEAGSWLMPRLAPHAVVMSKSVGQLTYYTSRAITDIPATWQEFDRLNITRPIDYLVLTKFEVQPRWLDGSTLHAMGFREVAAFPEAFEPDVLVFAR